MNKILASCAVSGQACFVAGRKPVRRNRSSQLACSAAQKRSDEDQSTTQKLAAAGLAAILLASQPQAASAKSEAAVASQDDLLTELLQKNGGKGVKIIKAPKKRVESEQDTPSPYSTSPAPATASAASTTAPKQDSFSLPTEGRVRFSGPVKSGTQGEYPPGYEGSDILGPKGKGVIKSAASSAKGAVQPAAPSNPLQQKQEGQNSSAPRPAFKNPLLARREAEEATKKAASAVKSAAADLSKVKLPNPFDQSAPEKQPEAPKAAFKNPLAEKRDAETAAKKAVSAVKDAVPEPTQGGLLNFGQKPKLPDAPTAAPKPVFKNPLLEKRDAEAAAKKAVSALKDAVPDIPKLDLPNIFQQKPELSKPESAPKPASKNPLLEKRDAEAAAKKAVSAVKDAVPEVPKFELPNIFEQKAELSKPESAPKPGFKNPLLEKRNAEAAARKAVSAVKDTVPDVPKVDLPNIFEQKPKLPDAPTAAPKPAFKNPLLEKRDAEAAAKKAVSAVKDAVPNIPKVDLPNIFEQKPELPQPESAPKPAFKNPLLEKRDAEAAAKKAVSAVKDAVPNIPKVDLPNIFEQKPELPQPESAPKPAFKNPLLEKRDTEAAAKKAVSAVKDAVPDTPKTELPKPAPTQKPAFENLLLAKRKAEDAATGAASSVSKAVEDAPKQATSSNPLGAAAGAFAGAAGSAGAAALSASSGVSVPSLPSMPSVPNVSLPSLPSLGTRSANDTTEAIGVLGAEVVAALVVSSIVSAITADVPSKKELNR